MNSNADTTDTLLDRFYSGLTSPDEERRLLDLLSDQAPDAGYEADRAAVAASLASPEIPDGLINRLDSYVSLMGAASRRRRRRRLWAAAAVVLVAVTFALWPRRISPYEVTDPVTAYQESVRALTMMGEELTLSRDNAASELMEVLSDFDFGREGADSVTDEESYENEYMPI